ncbi:MAG: hypothetical protein IJC81_03125 [Clostridia bacterium]|nr:hypothetical protein [Clostridia bacterium]
MKNNKVVSFGLLIAAFVFFCNPNINIFDLLSDCFACIFMIIALGKLGDICDDIGEAKRAFITLFWVNLAKLPALIITLAITGNNANERTMWLVVAFTFAVLEIVYAMRAFSLFFDGVAYLGTRNDGGDFLFHRVVRPEKQIKIKNGGTKIIPARVWRLEKLANFTSVFVIVKAVCCTIPEFVFIYRVDEINNAGVDLTHFRPHLFIFFGIIATVFAIIWVARMCSYVRYIASHSDFWKRMSEKYREEVLPRQGIFIMRYVYVFAVIFTVAVFMSVDLYLDEKNVLPDFISAILFFVSAFVIEKYSGGARALKITSAIYFVTSAFTYYAMLAFKTGNFSSFGYYYRNVNSIEAAKELYQVYAYSNAVTQVAFVAVMFASAAVMMRIVRAHTGINTLTGVSSSSRPLVDVYRGRIMRMRVISVLVAIMSIVYFFLIVYADRVPLRNGKIVYMTRFEFIWMLDFLVGMIYAIHASNLVGDIVGEVKYKYKYE